MQKWSDFFRNFYDRYWEERINLGRLHIKEGFWIPPRVFIAVNLIRSLYKEDIDKLEILDVGCGEGTLGMILRKEFAYGFSITGLDVSEKALKFAKPFYDEVIAMDIQDSENIPRVKRRFDLVIALEVLEHLPEPEIALRNIKSLMKKQAYFVASFPNMAWYRYRLTLLRGSFPQNYLLRPGEHFQNFTFYSFKELLNRAGFEMVSYESDLRFPRFFRPQRFFKKFFRRFPNLFGYQVVVLSKKQ